MEQLHKDQYRTENFEPKEGQRGSLCSNKTGTRCPSFSNYPNPNNMSKEDALDYLASILVEIVLAHDQQ